MADIAGAIFAAEHPGGVRDRGLGVTGGLVGQAHAALVACDRSELLQCALAVVIRRRRSRPGDLQKILRGLGGFDTQADDADAVRQAHHVGYARHLPRHRIVDRRGLAAREGHMQNGRIDHSRHLHVDAVFCGAGDLAGQLDARHVLADVAKTCW